MAKSKKMTAKRQYKELDGKSQNQFLHDYMRGTGITMTANEALKTFGIKSLSGRMTQLRQAGLRVVTEKAGANGIVSYKILGRDVNGSRKKLTV